MFRRGCCSACFPRASRISFDRAGSWMKGVFEHLHRWCASFAKRAKSHPREHPPAWLTLRSTCQSAPRLWFGVRLRQVEAHGSSVGLFKKSLQCRIDLRSGSGLRARLSRQSDVQNFERIRWRISGCFSLTRAPSRIDPPLGSDSPPMMSTSCSNFPDYCHSSGSAFGPVRSSWRPEFPSPNWQFAVSSR